MGLKNNPIYHIVATLFQTGPEHKVFDYKRSKDFSLIQAARDRSHFDDLSQAKNPFLMTRKEKTNEVSLLIHGLSDSPYYMKDIASTLFEQGHNIVAIGLSGHLTTPESLSWAKFEDWLEDIEFGFNEALKYGHKVNLIGMSTGGALIIKFLLLNKKLVVNKSLLISPALALKGKAEILCWRIMKGRFRGWKKYGKYVRYTQMANEGICSLCHLIKFIDRDVKSGTKINSPVRVHFMNSDITVDIEESHRKLQSLVPQLETFVFGTGKKSLKDASYLQRSDSMGHIAVLLKTQGFAGKVEVNPNFSVFKENIEEYFYEN